MTNIVKRLLKPGLVITHNTLLGYFSNKKSKMSLLLTSCESQPELGGPRQQVGHELEKFPFRNLGLEEIQIFELR